MPLFPGRTRPRLVPMTPVHVPRVLDIIRRFSEEDYEVACESLRRDLRDQYVLARGKEVLGVTGGRAIEGTDHAWWLSWTYLVDDARGQGLGQEMMGALFARLQRQGGRKIFVTTSDMRDAKGGRLYEAAIRAYERAGFALEVHHRDYYAPDDGQLVLGRRLRPPQTPIGARDDRGLILTDQDEIVETDDAWFIDWRFAEPGETPDTAATVQDRIGRIRGEGGRLVFVGLPSDAPNAEIPFRDAGFRDDGRLTDFYEDGVHENRLRLDLGSH